MWTETNWNEKWFIFENKKIYVFINPFETEEFVPPFSSLSIFILRSLLKLVRSRVALKCNFDVSDDEDDDKYICERWMSTSIFKFEMGMWTDKIVRVWHLQMCQHDFFLFYSAPYSKETRISEKKKIGYRYSCCRPSCIALTRFQQFFIVSFSSSHISLNIVSTTIFKYLRNKRVYVHST